MCAIVGLGKCGCSIAYEFNKYSKYQIFMIDSEENAYKEENIKYFKLKKYQNSELYEKNVPCMKKFFKGIEKKVLFIVGGSGDISGASLAILQQIKDFATINVLYIKPDSDFLNKNDILQEKVTFRVFQEYARSGLFEDLFIISNPAVESMIENYTILNYMEKINEIIVSLIHWYNMLESTSPVIDNFSQKIHTARINTFGINKYEKNEEILFFSFDKPRERRYYYIVNNEEISSNQKILLNIKNSMKIKKQKTSHQDVNISFGIYETMYDTFSFFIERTSVIQER